MRWCWLSPLVGCVGCVSDEYTRLYLTMDKAESLDWDAIGAEPPAANGALQLEGVVTLTAGFLTAGFLTPAALVGALAAFSTHASWFTTLAGLAEEGSVVGAADRAGLRHHVGRLLARRS